MKKINFRNTSRLWFMLKLMNPCKTFFFLIMIPIVFARLIRKISWNITRRYRQRFITISLLPGVSQIFRSTRCLRNHDVLRPYLRQVKLYKQHPRDRRSRFHEEMPEREDFKQTSVAKFKSLKSWRVYQCEATWNVYMMLLNNDTINMPWQCQHVRF